ncbi:X-box binding protein [Saccoglossus kowalevskii]|uniref:X-box-binding protein 1 n=1 Tax=Saccoglossus kowalevskii TaxID=10224 RepID=D1LXI7_SACKO|nr:X-box binding protein [Saccoglossus kowalevskii]ACY92693.1 X-box binding protein [Saccoglossus kowalevskii]
MATTTILITPARRITPATPLTTIRTTANMASPVTSDVNVQQPVRKRQRLTHLSPEEKFMRRKLKNRVAAQTARDRKKAHMDSIQSRVSILEAKNRQLLMANEALRKQSNLLNEENKSLKAQLRLQQNSTVEIKQEKDSKDTTLCKLERDGCGSAVLSVPQQKEHTQILSSWLAMLLLWSLNSCWGYSKTSTPMDSLKRNLETLFPNSPVNPNVPQMPRWWGPQQSQLESLNELIRFDHEYYKKPVICEQSVDNKTTATTEEKTVVPDMIPSPAIPDVAVLDMETEPDMSEMFSSSVDLNCNIEDLLSVDSAKCDSYSDSGISDSESMGFPASPLSNDWQETFTDLFPSLV